MQRMLSLVVVFLMLSRPSPGFPEPADLKAQVAGFAPGTKLEVLLTNNKTARGTRGAVSDSGFTLVPGREIAFADVVSVKRAKAHTGRNIAIVAGVIVLGLAVLLAVVGGSGVR